MKEKLCPVLLSYPNIIQLNTKENIKTHFISNTTSKKIVYGPRKQKYTDLQRVNIWYIWQGAVVWTQ
jgi:hypothetical protein